MKKVLMILAILLIVGVIGSFFISQNLIAKEPTTDPKPTKSKDPRVDYGGFIICYNYESTDCD
jgi:hypothetical protein